LPEKNGREREGERREEGGLEIENSPFARKKKRKWGGEKGGGWVRER